ncbi:hypothetical protein ACP70R_036291 [Stipagrostis hirtigluma subsp. patula]
MDKRPLLCQSPPRPPETHPSAASAPPSTYEPPPPPLLQPPTTPSTPRPAAAGTAPTTSPAPGSSPVTEERNGGVALAREGDIIGQGSGGDDLAATSGSTGAACTGHIAQGSSGSGSKTTDLMPFPPPAARPAEAIATPTLLPPGVSSPKNEDGSNSVSRSDTHDNDVEQGISYSSDGRGSTGSWWRLGDLFRSSDLSLPVTHRRSNQDMTSPSPSKPWFDPRQGQLLPDDYHLLRH